MRNLESNPNGKIETPKIGVLELERDSPQVILNLQYLPEIAAKINAIGHVAPLWKRLSPEGYAGTEVVAGKNIERNAGKIGRQIVFGHPDNSFLLEIPGIMTFSPTGPEFKTDHEDGLLGVLREDPKLAAELEQTYVKSSYDTIRQFGSDVDLVHDHSGKRDVGLAFAEESGKKVIYTIHGPVVGPYGVDDKELRSLASCKDKPNVSFVAISEDQMKDPSLPWGAVIHNGVDLSEFPFKPEAKKGLPDTGEAYFAWIGRIADTKGLEIAILAAAKVGKKLVVMGKLDTSVTSIKHYEEVIVPLLEQYGDTVIMVGEVGKRDRAKWLSGSRGVICPARWHEPFGYTSIEGPALGVPTIGPDYGAMKEIIVDGVNGFKVDITDPASITNEPESLEAAAKLYAEKMQVLLDGKGPNPRTCREYTAVHFSDTVMAAKYEVYYRYVLHYDDPTKIMTFREERLPNGLVQVTPILVDKKEFFKDRYDIAA